MFVTPKEALLWLATDRFSELTTSVHLDDERGSTKARVWSSTLKPHNFQSLGRRLVRSEVLFAAEEMPGGTEEGVIRWLDHWKRIRHSIGPVIARYRLPSSYTNDRLATSVSALESYSTTKRNWAELSDAEMARRTSVIRDALTEVELALVQWAVDALEDASRETLRNGLKELISDSGDLEPALFGSKKNQRQFIHEAVESRNRIAHLLPSGGHDDGGSLYWAHRGFIWLLRYHLMFDLGFAPEETARRIIKNYQFRQEAKRLRSDLETR